MPQQVFTAERAVPRTAFSRSHQTLGSENRDLQVECAWRHPAWLDRGSSRETDIRASRWVDSGTACRRGEALSPADRHVVSIALKATRLTLIRCSKIVFEGVMPLGMLHVTGPSQSLRAEFQSPCDFVHFYVANKYFRPYQAVGPDDTSPRDLNDFIVRDSLVEHLAGSLVGGSNAGDGLYAEGVGHIIVMRLLALRKVQARVGALPKWRLKRVQDYIEAYMDDSIGLAELAAAAGLSRMHFAAQFRTATGCRPHEYLIHQRIERAKLALSGTQMPLVEVALSVGFQAQSHFSSVFKRLTGETPARWRQAQQS